VIHPLLGGGVVVVVDVGVVVDGETVEESRYCYQIH